MKKLIIMAIAILLIGCQKKKEIEPTAQPELLEQGNAIIEVVIAAESYIIIDLVSYPIYNLNKNGNDVSCEFVYSEMNRGIEFDVVTGDYKVFEYWEE